MSKRALSYAERKSFIEGMVKEIVGIYEVAEAELIAKFWQAETTTAAQRARLTRVRTQVRKIREGLDQSWQRWATKSANDAYMMGVTLADRALLEINIESQAFTRIHQQAIIAIASDMTLEMMGSNASIDRVFGRYLRVTQQQLVTEAALSRTVAQGIAQGQARRTVSRRIHAQLVDKLKNEQFIMINGRYYRPGPYARLVARTRTREAVTQGVKSQTVLNGLDLVQVSFHATACPVCVPFEEKIYSLSGSHPSFPPLSDEPPYHPNCAHVLVPVSEEILHERGEYDREVLRHAA